MRQISLFMRVAAGIGMCCMLNQSYAQDAISAAGGNANGSGGSASYTIGQTVYTASSSATGSVSQGVQQAYTITENPVPGTPATNNPNSENPIANGIAESSIQCAVYPNPVADQLVVSLEDEFSDVSLLLFTADGRVVSEQSTVSQTAQIDMSQLAQGTYVLHILQGGTLAKMFTVVKNQ